MSPTAFGLCRHGAGDITSLLGKTLQYDTAGRLSQATGVPPCPGGVNCSGLQTTTSRYNGWGQRLLRENDLEQSVFSYGLKGFNLLSQTTRRLATSQQSTTEHIWLPTASGPMPIAAVIDGTHHAVHADHLNTPRRLSEFGRADTLAVALQRLWGDCAAEHACGRAGPHQLQPALPRPD